MDLQGRCTSWMSQLRVSIARFGFKSCSEDKKMLKAGDLACWEDHRVRGGQKRENPTRSGDITCMAFWFKS